MPTIPSIVTVSDRTVGWTSAIPPVSVLHQSRAGVALRANCGALQQDTQVVIGDSKFHVGPPIGSGSFGKVWAAVGDAGEVAIKEIDCNSSAALEQAQFEAELLRTFATCARPKSKKTISKVPGFVAASIKKSAKGCCMQLAMERLPGESLDTLIGQRPPTFAIGDPLERLAKSSEIACQMLQQVDGALTQISAKAYHRDIKAENIMVNSITSNDLEFNIVDFGLAVDATCWRQGSWIHQNISGDCRYWPTSGWLALESGTSELQRHSWLAHEYATKLDRHALGITAIQLFLWLLPEACLIPDQVLQIGIEKLRFSWHEFWGSVTSYSRQFNCARQGGEAELAKFRASLRSMEAHKSVARKLDSIRSALLALHAICNEYAAPGVDVTGVGRLAAALLDTISTPESILDSSASPGPKKAVPTTPLTMSPPFSLVSSRGSSQSSW
jgi:serine/threonine protein kinase